MLSRLSETSINNLRELVLKRDNWQCVICFKEPVQIHEIKPRSEAGLRSRKTFRLRNMVCLCPKCHTSWHNDGFSNKLQLHSAISEYLKQA